MLRGAAHTASSSAGKWASWNSSSDSASFVSFGAFLGSGLSEADCAIDESIIEILQIAALSWARCRSLTEFRTSILSDTLIFRQLYDSSKDPQVMRESLVRVRLTQKKMSLKVSYCVECVGVYLG